MENHTNEELIALYRETRDESIKDHFFERNINLAYFFANKYFLKSNTNSDEREEIASEATIGLVKAFNRFEVNNGAKFTTFAEAVIRNEVLNHYFRNYKNIGYPLLVYLLH